MTFPFQQRLLLLAAAMLLPSTGFAQIPTFQVVTADSQVNFKVDASVSIAGVFEKWTSTLRFTTPYVESGVLDIVVDAASVDAGSSFKERKLKGSDFFDVKHNPEITFQSKKIVQTAPDSYAVIGDFTIRGMTNEETLTVTYSPDRPDEGRVRGTMVFDRKQYGMTRGIPLIKIADRVEVVVDLKIHRTSGPRPIQKVP
jgi:polyisoprenoid-binding protein YceI